MMADENRFDSLKNANPRCGLGLRPELFREFSEQKPRVAFLEAHSENYFGHSLLRAKLLQIREDYPLSLHGVGLSLGRADELDQAHLKNLKALDDEVQALFISEHLSWSAYAHTCVPDLLPLPLTRSSFSRFVQHVEQMQEALGRSILIENPSNYLVFDALQIPETEFLNELCSKTGCGLLVDVNNIYVSAQNLGRDARSYIDALSGANIRQYHLAGYTPVVTDDKSVLIDTHNQRVHSPVWDLFAYTIAQHGARPTLMEWDSDFPEFAILLAECETANEYLGQDPQQPVNQRIQPVSGRATVAKQEIPMSMKTFQESFLDAVLDRNKTPNIRIKPANRLSVYQDNVELALQEYLAEVYPALQGVLGREFFAQLVRQLLLENPPKSGNLHDYGAGFAKVIPRFEALVSFPYLKDLIDYEWALHRSYFERTSDRLYVPSYSHSDLLTVPVLLAPDVSIIRSDFPIFEIHRQSLPTYDGEVEIRLDQSQDTIVVYKRVHKVYAEPLTPVRAQMIEHLRYTTTLQTLIVALQSRYEVEIISEQLTWLLRCELLIASSLSIQ